MADHTPSDVLEPRAPGRGAVGGALVRGLRAGARWAWYRLDEAWCAALLATIGDRPGLLSFLFHAVAEEDGVARMDRIVDPGQTLTTRTLSDFVGYFRRHGYVFVSPEDIKAGLDPEGRYVLMTFDDGYHNNLRILPVLHEHRVPATFFVCPNYVASGKAYWWDVVYRERTRQGVPSARVSRERESLKHLDHVGIEAYLLREFGRDALIPVGDDDRPMTREELSAFAREPWVHIGNHTADHAILTNYDEAGIEAQVLLAQEMLESMVGERPIMISYPNGNHSPLVRAVSERCGLELGVVYDDRRGSVPTSKDDLLSLHRLCFTRDQARLPTYRGFRSIVSLRRATR